MKNEQTVKCKLKQQIFEVTVLGPSKYDKLLQVS